MTLAHINAANSGNRLCHRLCLIASLFIILLNTGHKYLVWLRIIIRYFADVPQVIEQDVFLAWTKS